MSTFDDLKIAVDDLRKDYSDFTKLDLSGFSSPNEWAEPQTFTLEEAVALFEDQLKTIESALDNKVHCIRHVPEDDMQSVVDSLMSIKINIEREDYHGVVLYVENMISPIRSFTMLSMGKMDSRQYSEIKKLEDRYDEINLKFTQFLDFIQERSGHIDDQEIMTKNYEEKLKEYEKGYAKKNEEIDRLIRTAKEAVKGRTVQGLSGSFIDTEEKVGHIRIKIFWLSVALATLAGAAWLGWDTAKIYLDPDTLRTLGVIQLGFFTVSRALLVLIALSVAAFAARQYSKNKLVEFDYAYKAALVRAYPGLADEFQKISDGLRVEYVIKLIDEILQDPQRKRYKGNVSRFSIKPRTGRGRKEPEQMESPASENK